MKMKLLIVLSLISIFAGSHSNAALITIDFQGEITKKTNINIDNGLYIWGSYTYETTGSDNWSPDPSEGSYYAGSSSSMTVYGYLDGEATTLFQSDGCCAYIITYDDHTSSYYGPDPYDLIYITYDDSLNDEYFDVKTAYDDTTTMLSSDALPLTMPSISEFPTTFEWGIPIAWDKYGDVSQYATVSGDIIAWDSEPLALPLPSAIWLFLSGILGLITISKRKA